MNNSRIFIALCMGLFMLGAQDVTAKPNNQGKEDDQGSGLDIVCADDEILKFDGTTQAWECAADETNSATECGAGLLLDGAGNCVPLSVPAPPCRYSDEIDRALEAGANHSYDIVSNDRPHLCIIRTYDWKTFVQLMLPSPQTHSVPYLQVCNVLPTVTGASWSNHQDCFTRNGSDPLTVVAACGKYINARDPLLCTLLVTPPD